jgi:hypothetical protein
MTFWDDLKNMLISFTGIKGSFSILSDFVARAKGDDEVSDLSTAQTLQAAADASIRGKSEIFSTVPNILGMPILNDLYSPGFGVQVRRRVSSAYQANLLSPMDYVTHVNRFPEKEVDLRFFLSELGYNQEHEDILSDLYKYYPNAPDFVRFGVREVFKPHIVAKYGYDNDFPKEIIPHMTKAGLTEDVMQWFWRAHWELPSFYNIKDARHRDLITDSEVDEWLMVNDYAPYWRDILKGIVFNPYTRVDIRRMYDTGVVDRDQVKRTYKDLGYDEIHAENLTKFTILNSDKTKDVLSTYTNAYRKGIITETELTDQMRAMEYSEKEIELRISVLGSTEVAERPKRGLTLTNVKKLFTTGLIDSERLEDMLIGLNYSDDAVMYMKLLIISESIPHKAWTAEIKKGYKGGLLSRDETVARLSAIGYTMEAIDLSISLIDSKKEIEG